MQFRPLWLKLDRPAELANRAVKALGEVEHASQRAMCLRIVGGQARGFLRLAQRACQVSLADERVSEIHVCLHKIWLQGQRPLKLTDRRVDVVSRE